MLFIFVPRSFDGRGENYLSEEYQQVMKIRNILFVAAALCFAAISFGCGGTATNNTTTTANKPANTTSTTTTTSSTTTTAPANTASSTTASTAPDTGVAECDEYITKYEACLTKIAKAAPQVEPSMKQAFEAQRTSFKTAAANPQSKATLATTCKQAIETAKTATKAYACDW